MTTKPPDVPPDVSPDVLVPQRPPKVFGIGLHKTMTSSLANALYLLGYHVGGTFSTDTYPDRDALDAYVLEAAAHYDAIQDMPWPAFFRMLDEHFPGAKFVLTVRDVDRWLSSVVTHFGTREIASHTFIYGVPTAAGHEDRYREYFEQHRTDVLDHFADRPGDLLVMDIGAGHQWPELCAFLGLDVPPIDFPHQNPASGRRRGRLRRRARREFEAFARRFGVPTRWWARDRVRAEQVWGAMQLLLRRVDTLVGALGAFPDGRRRSAEAMLEAWITSLAAWAPSARVVDTETAARVRDRLADGDLAGAWRTLAFALRTWAGALVDEGFGVRYPDGADARPAVRRVVNGGLERYDEIVAVLDPAGELDRPADGLAPL